MALKKIYGGNYYIDDTTIDMKIVDGKKVVSAKSGVGSEGGLASLEGQATGAIDMMGHAITGAEKISTNGPAPTFIGSTIEPKGTAGARLTATSTGELAAVKPDSQDQYVPMHVGEPVVQTHVATRKYVDGVQTSLELQMPDKVGEYLATPAGQAVLQANAKPGVPGSPGRNGLDGNGIHVSTQSLVAQGSGNLNDLTGDNIKPGDVVLDADGVVYNIATVTDTQFTVGNEITKLIKKPIMASLPLMAGATAIYGGKYYKTSDGIVDVSFELSVTQSALSTAKNVVATLPVHFRPDHIVTAPATVQLQDGNRVAASVYCGRDGQITLSTNATNIIKVVSALTFIAE